MKFKKKTPAQEKNRFPFESEHPGARVLYQGIIHTHHFLKTSINKGKLI